MSYRLVILGVLAEQSRYGYDLKQTIEQQHYSDYIRLSGGGLYYHLRRLREEGYIEEQMVEREGTYPDRHIYRITERGRAYLVELLRETFADVAGRRVYDPLDSAFSFAFLLPQEEVLAHLQHQLDSAAGGLSRLLATQHLHRRVLERTAGQTDGRAKSESLYAQLMIDHNVALMQHEVHWLQEAIQRIEEDSAFTLHRQQDETGDTARASDEAITSEYHAFDDRLAPVVEATARYTSEMELAWQEYKRARDAGADLTEARQAYQQRMSGIRHVFDNAIAGAHSSEKLDHA